MPRIVSFAALLFTLGSSTAWGQEADDAVPAPVNAFELHESNFDRWVFGNLGNAVSARDRLEDMLALTIAEVERSCKLTDEQKSKLLLAGRGDIKRFFDRVEDARAVFQRLRRDQNKINEIFQSTQPLAAVLSAGIFGDKSFYAKTLRNTLTPDQVAMQRQAAVEKNAFRYRAKVRLAVADLDTSIGFTVEQRQKLVEVLLTETRPSLKSGHLYETTVVLLKASRLPEEKLRPILDETRWSILARKLKQAQGMEAFLKSQGFLDDDDPAMRAQAANTNQAADVNVGMPMIRLAAPAARIVVPPPPAAPAPAAPAVVIEKKAEAAKKAEATEKPKP
jgi:hypothetical protein